MYFWKGKGFCKKCHQLKKNLSSSNSTQWNNLKVAWLVALFEPCQLHDYLRILSPFSKLADLLSIYNRTSRFWCSFFSTNLWMVGSRNLKKQISETSLHNWGSNSDHLLLQATCFQKLLYVSHQHSMRF